MRTATEVEALRIAAEILHPLALARGEHRERDNFSSVRDVAAAACGMIHRDAHLLTRLPAAVQLRGRLAIPENAPCLINGFRQPTAPDRSRARSRRRTR